MIQWEKRTEAASMARKPDSSFEAQHGKKPNQKLKPYLVQQYLLKNTDEDHLVDAADIIAFFGILRDHC